MSAPNCPMRIVASGPPLDIYIINVPTEDGREAELVFERRRAFPWKEGKSVWSISLSDDVIVEAPEALTATLMLAIRGLRDEILLPELEWADA